MFSKPLWKKTGKMAYYKGTLGWLYQSTENENHYGIRYTDRRYTFAVLAQNIVFIPEEEQEAARAIWELSLEKV